MATVSDRDRAVMRRQAAALELAATDEVGLEDERLTLIARIDRERADRGLPPLKTESELHRKAVRLGLITR